MLNAYERCDILTGKADLHKYIFQTHDEEQKKRPQNQTL